MLDGHNSHVTLEVATSAHEVGLDLISLPSHTSHKLQPLDVSVFKPFKDIFRQYRDFWMSRYVNEPAGKETLAQIEWVSLSLKKALTASNICSGFRATGIHPLNKHTIDEDMGPSRVYRRDPGEGSSDLEREDDGEGTPSPHELQECRNSEVPDDIVSMETEEALRVQDQGITNGTFAAAQSAEGVTRVGTGIEEFHASTHMKADHARVELDVASPSSTQADISADFAVIREVETEHFFVNTDDCDLSSDEEIAGLDPEVEEPKSITKFLQLATVSARTGRRKLDPVVDFAKSIILTSAAYEEAARGVRDAREQAKQDKERQKEEREESRKRKAVEKSEAQARKLAVREERQREREARALEKAAIQEELNRQRETRAVEKAVAAARKVAEREAAARAKAERAQEVAMAKFLRASAERRNFSSPQVPATSTQTILTQTVPAETSHERRPWLMEPTQEEENSFGSESRYRSTRW